MRDVILARMSSSYTQGYRDAVQSCNALAGDEAWNMGILPFVGPNIAYRAAMIMRGHIYHAMWMAMSSFEFEAKERSEVDFEVSDDNP